MNNSNCSDIYNDEVIIENDQMNVEADEVLQEDTTEERQRESFDQVVSAPKFNLNIIEQILNPS